MEHMLDQRQRYVYLRTYMYEYVFAYKNDFQHI